MLPIVVKPQSCRIGLAGQSEGLQRRLDVLEAAGVDPVRIEPETPLDGLSVLFVAGLDEATSAELAARARAQGILVNVEDVPALCDFNVPAMVRRGDLLFTVSTNGRSPGLARRLREWLEQCFGPVWQARVNELADERDRLRSEGVPIGEVAARVRRIIDEKGWLA